MTKSNSGPSKLGGLGKAGSTKTGLGMAGAGKSVTKATPSGNSGGAKAAKVLGKTTTFTPGKLTGTSKAVKPGAPVISSQRMGKPQVAPQKVNKDRLDATLKKLGF